MTIKLEHAPKAPFRVSGTLSAPEIVDSKKPSSINIHLKTVDVAPGPKIWSGKIIVGTVIERVGPGIDDVEATQTLNVESIPFDYSLEFEINSKIPKGLYKYTASVLIEDVLSQKIIAGYSENYFRMD